MPDSVESYLISLHTRLAKRMSVPLAEEHVREIGMHLRDSVASRVEIGNSLEVATVEALQALGSDALVADGLIRLHLGLNTRSVWRFVWLPCLVILTYGFVPWTMNMVEFPTWMETYANWIPFGVISTFGYACWRSRKVLMKPMSLTLVAVLAFTVLNFSVFSPYGASQHSHDLRMRVVAGFDRNIRDTKAKIIAAETMRRNAVVGLSRLAPSWNTVGFSSDIAGLPFTHHESKVPVLGWQATSSQQMAKALWAKNGNAFIGNLNKELQDEQSNKRMWLNIHPNMTWIKDVAIRTSEMMFLIWTLLAAINLAVLLSVKLSIVIRNHLWTKSVRRGVG